MDDSDKEAFATAITAMLVTFGQEATKPRLMGYWLGLKDLALEKVEHAVAQSMQTAKRLPVPAELREIATGGGTPAQRPQLRGLTYNAQYHLVLTSRLTFKIRSSTQPSVCLADG